MSSDSAGCLGDAAKVSCFKKMTEVQQYVLQGKRDPYAIEMVLQLLIDDRGITSDFIYWLERTFIENIMRMTTQRKLQWTYNNMDDIDTINAKTENGTIKAGGFLHYIRVADFATRYQVNHYQVNLIHTEKEFFKNLILKEKKKTA